MNLSRSRGTMSESLTDQLGPDFLENIIMEAADKVMHDEMDDHTRVILYRLALTVCASEMVRIEKEIGGVKPEVLMLLQQISLLCDEDTGRDKLIANARKRAGDANKFLEVAGDMADGDNEDGGSGIVTPGEVREGE